jgi:hypothetical protein
MSTLFPPSRPYEIYKYIRLLYIILTNMFKHTHTHTQRHTHTRTFATCIYYTCAQIGSVEQRIRLRRLARAPAPRPAARRLPCPGRPEATRNAARQRRTPAARRTPRAHSHSLHLVHLVRLMLPARTNASVSIDK